MMGHDGDHRDSKHGLGGVLGFSEIPIADAAASNPRRGHRDEPQCVAERVLALAPTTTAAPDAARHG
jgi:hypothetical protein